MTKKEKLQNHTESALHDSLKVEEERMNLVPADPKDVASEGARPTLFSRRLDPSTSCADELFLTNPKLRAWHTVLSLACSYLVPAMVYGTYWTIRWWVLDPVHNEIYIPVTFLKNGNCYGTVALVGGASFWVSVLLFGRHRSYTYRPHLVLWMLLFSFMLPYLCLGVLAHWRNIVDVLTIKEALRYLFFDAFLFAFGLPGAMGGITAASTFLLFNLKGFKSESFSEQNPKLTSTSDDHPEIRLPNDHHQL